MPELKTKVNTTSVTDFLNAVPNERRKTDGLKLLNIFQESTGEKAKMWGSSIVGFGQYHYKSERSSQEGDWMMVGFSPRKVGLSLYVLTGFPETDDLLAKLGKHKRAVGCLYILNLDDVDISILKQIIRASYRHMKKLYHAS